MTNKIKLFISTGLLLFAGAGYYVTQVFPYRFGMQNHFPVADTMGNYDSSNVAGVFHGKSVVSPEIPERDTRAVLGSQDPSVEKRIEVDLTHQKLYALEDSKIVAEFDVSTGKWGRTPTGTFRVWIKLKAARMNGGSVTLGTYYDLPNVPYTMYFYNEDVPKHLGFGIHGAYWHSNFGEVMSHGCINMRTRDVEKLFYWATPEIGDKNIIHSSAENPGIEIKIYGEAKEQ